MPLLKRDPHAPILQASRRRYGALQKDASFASKLLRPVLRPESRSAMQLTNGIHFLPFRQAAGRAACSVGVDADWRRVLCRALDTYKTTHYQCRLIHGGWAMAVSFQKSHSNFCRKSRTPPFPQTKGPE
jgi:hypothetical protein